MSDSRVLQFFRDNAAEKDDKYYLSLSAGESQALWDAAEKDLGDLRVAERRLAVAVKAMKLCHDGCCDCEACNCVCAISDGLDVLAAMEKKEPI